VRAPPPLPTAAPNAVGIQVRRLAAVIALVKALGGGWHEG
jgi:hypothetical protein